MTKNVRLWVLVSVLTILVAGARFSASAAPVHAAPFVSTITAIRAAYHPETTPRYDRVVFQFDGPVPLIEVGYVKQLIGGGSGLPVPIQGNAIVQVTMRVAQAHDDQGRVTAPTRIAYRFPIVKEVAVSSDFEGVLSYGIGLSAKSELRVLTLDNPSRVVIDVIHP